MNEAGAGGAEMVAGYEGGGGSAAVCGAWGHGVASTGVTLEPFACCSGFSTKAPMVHP